jgi:nicotinamidase/pyrazinamidase
MSIKLDKRCALIIEDMQNDFMPNGTLPVPDADRIVPVLNKYAEMFASKKLPIVATRDWHPPDHISFKQRGGEWPVHCVKDTLGAEFLKDLKIPGDATVISKATERDVEAYSSFKGTDLAKKLDQSGVKRIFIGGVATEYCVKETALDAIRLGFDVVILKDAVKGIQYSDKAIEEMLSKGVKIAIINDISN